MKIVKNMRKKVLLKRWTPINSKKLTSCKIKIISNPDSLRQIIFLVYC